MSGRILSPKKARSGCPDKIFEKLVAQRKSGQELTKVSGQNSRNFDFLGSSLGRDSPGSCPERSGGKRQHNINVIGVLNSKVH